MMREAQKNTSTNQHIYYPLDILKSLKISKARQPKNIIQTTSAIFQSLFATDNSYKWIDFVDFFLPINVTIDKC